MTCKNTNNKKYDNGATKKHKAFINYGANIQLITLVTKLILLYLI